MIDVVSTFRRQGRARIAREGSNLGCGLPDGFRRDFDRFLTKSRPDCSSAPPLRLAGAAFTCVPTRLMAIAPFWSTPVALVVKLTEAALAVPPEATTAVTGEESAFSTAADSPVTDGKFTIIL